MPDVQENTPEVGGSEVKVSVIIKLFKVLDIQSRMYMWLRERVNESSSPLYTIPRARVRWNDTRKYSEEDTPQLLHVVDVE